MASRLPRSSTPNSCTLSSSLRLSTLLQCSPLILDGQLHKIWFFSAATNSIFFGIRDYRLFPTILLCFCVPSLNTTTVPSSLSQFSRLPCLPLPYFYLPPHQSRRDSVSPNINIWIKSIQTVTKLNLDVASGTVSQHTLEHIENRLRSEDVGMVMRWSRSEKRFLATVVFIADTGLKDASNDGMPLSSLSHSYADSLVSSKNSSSLSLSVTTTPRVIASLHQITRHGKLRARRETA